MHRDDTRDWTFRAVCAGCGSIRDRISVRTNLCDDCKRRRRNQARRDRDQIRRDLGLVKTPYGWE
jgi:hypothetical protein